jgi:hypothetical protein
VPAAVISLFLVHHWATFCTNRQLLGQFMRIYCLFFSFLFILTVWAVGALFVGFRNIHAVAEADDAGNVYENYIVSATFLCIFGGATVIAVLDIWAYSDDVLYRG